MMELWICYKLSLQNLMQNPLERQKSLKKLHFCIANYHPTHQEISSLVSAQQDLKDQIQFKFRRSAMNQSYIFPSKHHQKDQYSGQSQIVNLHQIDNPNDQEPKQKMKIKLAKGRCDKRLQTQHYQRSFADEQYKFKNEDKKWISNSKPLAELNQNQLCAAYITQPVKQRVKTQNERDQFLKREGSTKRLQATMITNTLQRQSINSKGKSRLSMLTKSYMNLKTAKQPLQYSLQKQVTNVIRKNDYKFMPNGVSQRNSNNPNIGFNSTREVKNLAFTANFQTQNSAMKPVDPKSLEKIDSLLPGRRYAKVK